MHGFLQFVHNPAQLPLKGWIPSVTDASLCEAGFLVVPNRFGTRTTAVLNYLLLVSRFMRYFLPIQKKKKK